MSQLTQLAFAYKVGKEQKLPIAIDSIIDQVVAENKHELIKAVCQLDYPPLYIVESFVCTILKGMFNEKNREELLQVIAGGSIFKIKSKLHNSFLNNEDIKLAIEREESSCSQTLKV